MLYSVMELQNRVARNTFLVVFVCAIISTAFAYNAYRTEDKTKCPKVKSIRNFDLEAFLGKWYVNQYYSSSEEDREYQCMQSEFTFQPQSPITVTMNFTYSFIDDPVKETIVGNITWMIPDIGIPSHWVHTEYIYEGVYNTYILDSDYTSWALLLHCAEKSKTTRYLSSFIMSREMELGPNILSYLREKLLQYDIDLSYMFDVYQSNC